MSEPGYDLYLPETRSTGAVFSSPHSGRLYPAAFLAASVLDEHAIRSSEDAYVDRLYGDAPRLGAPLIAARMPRAYLDLNRSPDELDPALIEGPSRGTHNPRINSGLGVIPRVVSNGRAIYRGKLTPAEAEARIAGHWRPYHTALARLLDQSRRLFGQALLIDCHSMPHEAIDGYGHGGGRPRPEVVLGDRFGTAARGGIVERIEAAFAVEGLRVARNAPFAGAYITQAYGRPAQGCHVVQIEIDWSLYMDERTITPLPRFDEMRALIGRVMAEIVEIGRGEMPLAAE